ncbi:hypothetical protein NQ318_005392 [Aromia moschata]|uniref:Uncharacterized protein n=1 Tax=Aromia moschata TaxID=1265417 RepID=A0AAV8YYP4_9CUCU|nr:hypothetical protein NQ318_005392 [Aromia moschata]
MPPPEVNNVRSSARRCLRLTSNVEEGAVVGGTKSSKRRLSMSINKDDEKISVTEKKIDLNESIRTTMLKVRLKKAEIFESISGSSKFFYDTSSDENEENVSEKSKGRSRSTESDSSWSPGTPPKARRLTETSVNPGHPPGESVPNTPRTKQQAASFTAKEPPSRTRSRSLRSDKEEASDTQRPSRVHSPAKDSDDDRSSPCKTPSKTPKARRRTNRRESQAVCKTPKAPRTPRSSAKQTLKTPGSRARLIREGGYNTFHALQN